VQTTQLSEPQILSQTMDTTRSLRDLLDVEPHEIDWEAFIARTKTHPYEVKVFGSFLLTVIKRSPPVEALIAATRICPDSALTSEVGFNVNRRVLLVSPLGLACKCGASFDVIRAILREIIVRTADNISELYPGVKRSRTLDNILETTGIHEPNFSLDLLKLFLEELPSEFFTQNTAEGTCLAARLVMENIQDSDHWKKINMVLKATTAGMMKDDDSHERPFLVLHAFLEMIGAAGPFRGMACDYLKEISSRPDIDTVVSMLELIKKKAPEQFHIRNENGLLPLSVVMTSPRFTDDKERERDYASKLVTFLLNEYPESAHMPDKQKRLPLHVATEGGLPCIELLEKVEPRALETRCPVTHMYPFQLVAFGLAERDSHESSPRKSVDTIFTLLCKAPHLLENETVHQPWMDSPEYKQIQRNKLKIAQVMANAAQIEAQLTAENAKLEQDVEELKRL